MIFNEIAIGILIALGAGIMFLSILRTRQVLWLLKGSKYTYGWRTLLSLMIFFLVGYVATLAPVLAGITEILAILTGVIFFFGAVDVGTECVDRIAHFFDTVVFGHEHDIGG